MDFLDFTKAVGKVFKVPMAAIEDTSVTGFTEKSIQEVARIVDNLAKKVEYLDGPVDFDASDLGKAVYSGLSRKHKVLNRFYASEAMPPEDYDYDDEDDEYYDEGLEDQIINLNCYYFEVEGGTVFHITVSYNPDI